jgi:hypothetical protein
MNLITVSFGTVQRANDEITAGWIVEQQHAREREGGPVAEEAEHRMSGNRS